MTTKAGGSRSCAPRQDVKRWSTLVATRCTPESPERRAYVRRRRRPSRQDGAETDKGQPGKLNVCARVGREGIHARPELYAATSLLEALKVVLSEVATGERG